MADLSRTIELIFSGTDDTSRAIRDINSSLNDFGDATQGIAAPLSDMANRVLQVQGALVLFGGVIGGIAFNEAVKFESAVAELKKQLDDTDPSIDSLLSKIKDLALTFGVSSDALVIAAADFKQAGFSASDSLLLLEQSLRLVRAGGVEAGEASEILIASLKGFKSPASEAAHLIEVLNAGSNAYATNVTELGLGMSQLSPIAATMGLSFEDTADILIPVIEVFRSGSEASDALKTGLLSLLKPTGDAADELKRMGVAVTDQNGVLRNGRDIVFDFAAAFVQLEGSQQAQVAATIFGKDQAARLIEAFNGLGNKTVDVADAMTRVASVQEEVNVALAKSETIIDRTRVAFEELAKTVGAEYKTELVGVIDATGAFAKALDDAVASGRFDKLFDLIAPQLKAIEDVIRAVAANLDEALAGVDFTNLVDSLGNVGDSLKEVFGAFFGDIDLNTVEGLQSALQKTADAFAALNNVTAGIIESFVPFFEAIREGVDNFSELGETSQRELGQVLGVMKQIIDFGSGVGLAFVAIGQAGIEMGRIMDGVFAAVRLGVNTIEAGFQQIAITILDAFAIIAGINSKLTFGDLSAEFSKFSAAASGTADVLREKLAKNSDEARAALSDLTGAFDAGNPKYQEAKDRLDKLAESLKGTADTTKDTGDAFTTAVTPANHYITELEQLGNIGREAALKNRELGDSLGHVDSALGDTVKKTGEALDATKGYRKIIDEATGAVIGYEQVGGKLATSLGETVKNTDEAVKKTEEFALKLEEIASNERIKTLEFAVDLKIADLEATTKQVEAAFGSISAIVESTGDVISSTLEGLSLFSDAGNFLSSTQRTLFQTFLDQLELENDIRQKAADDAHSLNEAIIDNLRAKTEALARGDSLITIQADGLEPHIRAFMWEILKEIQVEANADMQEFLLGFTPAA